MCTRSTGNAERPTLYRHHDFEDLDADITFSPSHGEDKCICLYLPLDY